MSFPFYIAKRYLVAKSSNNTINIISLIASLGIIVGTLALFIILSGFAGFRTFTDALLNSSDPDIRISATKGKSFLFTDSISSVFYHQTEIQAFSPIIEERVFLRYKEKEHIAYVKGVTNEYRHVISVDSIVNIGTWLETDYKNAAVIGSGITNKLSIGIFGNLEIVVPKPGKGIIVNPSAAINSVETQIIGEYGGMEDFANKYVFVDIELAKQLLDFTTNQITSIELRLKNNVEDHELFAKKLQQELGDSFQVETRLQFNSLTYKVLKTERLMSYFIFTLIVIIALFNVIGAIIMMIIDKKENLKTLSNLGLTVNQIKKIFIFQGFLLTLFGAITGLLIGTILVFLQKKFEFFMITQSIAYPVEFRFINLIIVAITIGVLGYIAAKIASGRISKEFLKLN